MRLIVYSALPLDKLRDLVVADFQESLIPIRRQIVSISPYSRQTSMGILSILIPLKIHVRYPSYGNCLRNSAHMTETQPAHIVCQVLGHEGTESLLAQLKRENLAESIRCGPQQLGANAVLFVLDIELTDEGVKQVNEVIERTFQAIANFRQKEIPQYLFDELHRMSEISYQYPAAPRCFPLCHEPCQMVS